MEPLHTYGEVAELENTQYKLHPFANTASGGIDLRDEEGVVRGAIKELVQKVAKKALKGQVTDLMSTPAPSQIHDTMSHLNLQ